MATEEQNPAPATETPAEELPSGVTQDGGTTRVVSEPAPAQEEPAKQDGPPEGFDTWEAYGRAQAAKLEQASKDGGEVTTKGTEEEAPKTGVDLIVQQNLEGVSPDMAPKVEPFIRAFAETGTLTDEQVTQAAKDTGFSEAMVRQYMANGQAQATAQDVAHADAFRAAAGGQEGWDAFGAWAKEALSPEDIAKIDTATQDLTNGKVADIQNYLDLFKASGRAPAPVDLSQGAAVDPSGGVQQDVYASTAEMAKDTGSRKYQTDPAFRASVEAKIKRSNLT